jgi:hypothetical protein
VPEPGDCNADTSVDAGDLSAIILEVFGGEGMVLEPCGADAFLGGGTGCDANEDATIDAGDVSCVILLIFEGPGACSG